MGQCAQTCFLWNGVPSEVVRTRRFESVRSVTILKLKIRKVLEFKFGHRGMRQHAAVAL